MTVSKKNMPLISMKKSGNHKNYFIDVRKSVQTDRTADLYIIDLYI